MPLTLDGTNGEVFPSWTTATRPASPVAGQTGFNTTTGQLETYNGSGWRISTAASTQGTSGQYLQSAGAGAAPTWATLSATGSLIRAPQILTSGTSYTTPSNCTAIYVEAVGGGGGGGGKDNVANDIGGSGGGGAYCAKYFTVTSSTAYTYAIGAAGTGGAAGANAGVAGGDTTFTVGATTITANGGNAGAAGTTTSQKIAIPTTGVNGDINVTGQYGISFAGGQRAGGSSMFGGGRVVSESTTTQPTAASNYGGGGAGGYTTSTGLIAGGNGSQGVIRVWEYT